MIKFMCILYVVDDIERKINRLTYQQMVNIQKKFKGILLRYFDIEDVFKAIEKDEILCSYENIL